MCYIGLVGKLMQLNRPVNRLQKNHYQLSFSEVCIFHFAQYLFTFQQSGAFCPTSLLSVVLESS